MEFKYLPLRLPAKEWAKRLQIQLIGIAHTSASYGQLWLADDNRYFTTNDIDDTFAFVASGFQNAVRNLLAGNWMQPLLQPGVSSVMIYGEMLFDGDPRLYDWKATLSQGG